MRTVTVNTREVREQRASCDGKHRPRPEPEPPVGSRVPPGPGKEPTVPVFKLEAEDGTWLTDVRLGPPDWKPGDRIPHGKDTLEVVEVRDETDKRVLVVRGRDGQRLVREKG
jgi:hypothetical protein